MDKVLRISIVFLLASAVITSCNGAGIFDVSAGMGAPNPITGLVHTETPTPFLPLSPTGSLYTPEGAAGVPTSAVTPTPTLADPWGDFPGPTQVSAIAIDPPVSQINVPEKVVNILLLGSDEGPTRSGHRTDTIMILSLHSEAKRVTILSIPRDLFVYIPGWRVDRINVADTFGGIEMVYQTILYNFGIEIDYWVRANFNGFEASVDHLGGIDVQVGSYLYDECGGVYYEYFPGTYSMDGQTALCYVRMRKTTSDFHRNVRQQEVLKALFQKVLSLDGLTKIPQLYNEFNKWVESNIELTDLLPLIPMASDLASGKATFETYSLSGDMVINWTMPLTGAQVLLPDRDKIRELLSTIYPY